MKKFLSLLLAFIMVISIFAMPTFAVEKEVVEVGVALRTKAEALAWAKDKADNKRVVGDGWCSALASGYIQYLTGSYLQVNGNAYATRYPSGWTPTKYYSGYIPQPGDLVVYDHSDWAWVDGVQCGHVGIVYSANASSFTSIEQNASGRYTQYCYNRSYTSSSLHVWGFIRPEYKEEVHTHSYDTYVYYLDSHPHYKCYKCICGEVKSNRSEPTYVSSCEECVSHTCDKAMEYSYWSAHPHYPIYQCSLCGKNNTDYTQTKYISSCEECVSHTCDKAIEYSYWSAHPHYPIYQCSLCGKNNTDYTQTKYISSCEECIAHTCNKDIEYSYWAAHPHYPIYQCSLCGKYNTDYTQTKYISSCEECVVQIDMILGDVDGDKKVSIMDATEIQRHIAQLSTIPEDRLSCADTDRDTRISIMDATQIQRFIAQLIPSL